MMYENVCAISKMVEHNELKKAKRDLAFNNDTGWRFFSGEEDASYLLNYLNYSLVTVEALVKQYPWLSRILTAPVGTVLENSNGIITAVLPNGDTIKIDITKGVEQIPHMWCDHMMCNTCPEYVVDYWDGDYCQKEQEREVVM